MKPSLFLIARFADRTIAVDTAGVDSVVDIGRITPVPGAVPAVVGLAALRSRVVTVVDPRVALGSPAVVPAPTRAIMIQCDGHDYAMLVDALEDIAPFDCVAVVPADGASGWRGIARGTIVRDGEPILVVDLTALVPGLALAQPLAQPLAA